MAAEAAFSLTALLGGALVQGALPWQPCSPAGLLQEATWRELIASLRIFSKDRSRHRNFDCLDSIVAWGGDRPCRDNALRWVVPDCVVEESVSSRSAAQRIGAARRKSAIPELGLRSQSTILLTLLYSTHTQSCQSKIRTHKVR